MNSFAWVFQLNYRYLKKILGALPGICLFTITLTITMGSPCLVWADLETLIEADVLADSYFLSDDHITLNQVRGPHLIYDCDKKRWGCVDPKTFKVCEEDEKKAWSKIHALRSPRVPMTCRALHTFKDHQACFKQQAQLVEENFGTHYPVKCQATFDRYAPAPSKKK